MNKKELFPIYRKIHFVVGIGSLFVSGLWFTSWFIDRMPIRPIAWICMALGLISLWMSRSTKNNE